jgi:uncharacterized protein YjdB
MSNLNLRINTAQTIVWVTCLSDALPVTAGTTLTDVTHEGADGSAATGDGVHDNPDNHVLYHDVQDALYRQLGLQNMQNISIVPSGALAGGQATAAALSIVEAATDTVDIVYADEMAATNADWTYESADELIATVASTGVVTAVAEGETVVTATHKHTGATVDCAITVTAA